nr:hypothetical protein [Tanacetum cinerariifolium]
MLGSFKIKSKLADLTAFTKLHRVKTNISHKVKPKTPTVTRKSLRAQGKGPDYTGIKDKFWKQELEPVSMKDANTCSKSDQ